MAALVDALCGALSSASLSSGLAGVLLLLVAWVWLTKRVVLGDDASSFAAAQRLPGLLLQFAYQLHKQTSNLQVERLVAKDLQSSLKNTAAGLKTTPDTKKVRVCCPGGGMFFFWQLGVCRWLQTRVDMDAAEFVGCSSGALVAVLCACGCDLQVASDHAFEIARQNELWSRPLGLAGCWGRMIRQWLHDLLPEDAAQRCSGRVTIIATQLPSFSALRICTFATKDDVIDAAMASVHVPFFLDWSPVAPVGSTWCLDGHLTFPPTFGTPGVTRVVQWAEEEVFAVDHHKDEALGMFGGWDFLRLKGTDSVLQHMSLGYGYAQRMWERRGGETPA